MPLREKLPVLPVPLRPPEADVPLDLAQAFAVVYERAGYDLSVDYRRPPVPPLERKDAEWAAALLDAYHAAAPASE